MMILKELVKADYQHLFGAKVHNFPAETEATFRQIKRLEAMKQFKADSERLRAEISRMRAERNRHF